MPTLLFNVAVLVTIGLHIVLVAQPADRGDLAAVVMPSLFVAAVAIGTTSPEDYARVLVVLVSVYAGLTLHGLYRWWRMRPLGGAS